MERRTESYEQLTLFDVATYMGRTALSIGNVVYVQFGQAEHDPFIDDLNGLPPFDDIA